MKTTERILIITELAIKDANIGKTAMMKFLYLLQTLYAVPLGYDFQIYTYGPYSQAVMSDIELADYWGDIIISPIQYPNGMNGYNIIPTDEGKMHVSKERAAIDPYNDAIKNIIKYFSDKTAKELELDSTLVFVSNSYNQNGWNNSKDEICSAVKQIKPHFSDDDISCAYSCLLSNGYINH